MIHNKKLKNLSDYRREKYDTCLNEYINLVCDNIKYTTTSSNDSVDVQIERGMVGLVSSLRELRCINISEYLERFKSEVLTFAKKYKTMLKKEDTLVKKICTKIDKIMDSSLSDAKKKEMCNAILAEAQQHAMSPYFSSRLTTKKYEEFIEKYDPFADFDDKEKSLYDRFVKQMTEFANSSFSAKEKIEKINAIYNKATKKLVSENLKFKLYSLKENLKTNIEINEQIAHSIETSKRLDALKTGPSEIAYNQSLFNFMHNDPEIKKMMAEAHAIASNNPTNSSGTKH